MAHGQPDYGMYAPKETIGSIADNAELAARLGSIVTFDRKGDVVYLDDFEAAINKWDFLGGGGAHTQEQSAEHARNGLCCMKLTCGAAIGSFKTMIGYYSYPVLGKMGMEISFTVHDDLTLYLWELYFRYGAGYYHPQIRYRPATDVWEVDNNGAWVPFATVPLYAATHLFNTLKIVVDLTALRYVRFLLNNHVYDMSAYIVDDVAVAGIARIEARVTVTNSVAALRSAYFDDFILTQNEP